MYLLQVEFVRIDPFVRKTMTNKNGVISAKFMVRSFNAFFPLAHRLNFFVTVSSFLFGPSPCIRIQLIFQSGSVFLLNVMYSFDQYFKVVIYVI